MNQAEQMPQSRFEIGKEYGTHHIIDNKETNWKKRQMSNLTDICRKLNLLEAENELLKEMIRNGNEN